MPKKNQKTKKMPEKSQKEKLEHYKGENKLLKKRMTNLERRVHILEQKLDKFKDLDVETFANYKKKSPKESFREKFLREWHPNYKEEDEKK